MSSNERPLTEGQIELLTKIQKSAVSEELKRHATAMLAQGTIQDSEGS